MAGVRISLDGSQLLYSPSTEWKYILKHFSTFIRIQLQTESKNMSVVRNLYLAFCLKH
jgi:hypothetical protein